MSAYLKWSICFAACWLFWPGAPAAGEEAPYRDLLWEELVPADWHPEKMLEGLDLANLSDDDPRVEKAFEAFMAEFAKAPTRPEVDGQRVKIPGFIVPLDWEDETLLKEFLLVPYFGACIHVPPPPANQILYIRMDKPLEGARAMDAIWAYGVIFLERNDSGSMGASGYSMKIEKTEQYRQWQ